MSEDHNEAVDRKLSLIGSGKMAELAYYHFHEIIKLESNRLLNELKSFYRSGNMDNVLLAAKVAGICALDDLDNSIKRKIGVSRKAEEEIHNANG